MSHRRQNCSRSGVSDFGATFLVAQKALALGLTPLYSTIRREAVEQVCGDKVQLTHQFRHVRFRHYETV